MCRKWHRVFLLSKLWANEKVPIKKRGLHLTTEPRNNDVPRNPPLAAWAHHMCSSFPSAYWAAHLICYSELFFLSAAWAEWFSLNRSGIEPVPHTILLQTGGQRNPLFCHTFCLKSALQYQLQFFSSCLGSDNWLNNEMNSSLLRASIDLHPCDHRREDILEQKEVGENPPAPRKEAARPPFAKGVNFAH